MRPLKFPVLKNHRNYCALQAKLKEVIKDHHLSGPGSKTRLTNSVLERSSILKLAHKLRNTPEGKLHEKTKQGQQRLKILAKQSEIENPSARAEIKCAKTRAQWGGTNLAALKCILVNYGGGIERWDYFKGGTPIKGPTPESTVFGNDNPISLAAKEQRENNEQRKFNQRVYEKINNFQNPKYAPSWVSEDDNKQAYKNFLEKVKNARRLDKLQANPEGLTFLFPVSQSGQKWCSKLKKFTYGKRRPCAGPRYHNTFSHPAGKMSFGSRPLVFATISMLLGVGYPGEAASTKAIWQILQNDPQRRQSLQGLPPFVDGPQKEHIRMAAAKADFRSCFLTFKRTSACWTVVSRE